ncbi:hypothetical protein [Streptomyces olivaceoviridis]|uniref:hypothetical protein n=1 Tax=Streptomyces olivaceoviridis TaxID=1921 RepID=UPI0036F9EFA4
MHRTRTHLRLIEVSLVGAAIGTGNAWLWWVILGPHTLPWWAYALIAVPSALLLMSLAASAHRRAAAQSRPRPGRHAHARFASTTRKAA